ncbi:MAG: photosynthetic complex assembly protein PuhC [Gammaproteobacteria bacterium]
MSGHFNEEFPRGPLIGACSLVLITLIGVGIVQFSKDDRSAIVPPTGVVLEQRALRFEDAANGSVLVYDHATGDEVDALTAGTNNFLRATLRGLARDRGPMDIGPEQPFHIRRYSTGRILLVDPVTNRQVDLLAFGPDNARVFSRYLAAPLETAGTAMEIRQ